jgi:YHS domain-containing protein
MKPKSLVGRAVLLVAFAVMVTASVAAVAADDVRLLNLDKNGVILDGYDPVAFFTDGKPVLGSDAFQSTYRGAIYHFASADDKSMFDQEPAKYEPQFGAFCAYAVSVGRTAPIDVNTFSIVNGRLVVQHNSRAVGLWNKDPQGNLKLADKYWPAVAKNGGKQIKVDE